MRTRPTSHRRRATMVVLAAATALSLALLAVRFAVAAERDYDFLVWNLFLAWVPLGLALLVYDRVRDGRRGGWTLVLAVAWLLFLPNAPYIVTDYLHLAWHDGMPLWFDGLLVTLFAATGVALGFVSLSLMQGVVARLAGVRTAWAFVLVVLGLSSVGIYLGRVDRLNSWDAVTNPGLLRDALWGRLANPLDHSRFVAAVVAATVLLTAAYAVLHATGLLRAEPDDARSR